MSIRKHRCCNGVKTTLFLKNIIIRIHSYESFETIQLSVMNHINQDDFSRIKDH